ncbi:MAG: discoidin domain-containing protein, partial [Acutalibacteraceae bacterium]
MKKSSLSVRILTVLLSVAVLCSSLFVLPLSAEEYAGAHGIISPDSKLGASLSSLTDEEVEDRQWSNLAASSSGKEPLKLPIYCSRANIRYTPSSEANSYTPSRLARLVDGEVSDSNYGNGNNYGGGVALQRNPQYATPSVVMPKIQIDLGEQKEISEILISWASGAPVKAYNIYASKTRDFSTTYTWFSDYSGRPEQILSVTGETEASCNRLITLDTPAVYRYIVIEFREFSDETKDYSGEEWTGVLLTELGVYAAGDGMPEYTVENITDETYISAHHAENLVAGPISLTYGGSADDGALLYDGKTDMGFTVSVESGQKLRLTAKLDGVPMVDSFLISTSEACSSVSYRVFAGMGGETVFSGENYVAHRKYKAGDLKTSLLKLSEPRLASCIGIQFSSSVTVEELGAVIELLEIAVYGDKPEELDVTTSVSDTSAVNSDKTAARKSENLLGDGYCYITLSDGCTLQNTDGGAVEFPRSLDMLYDGDAATDSFDGSEKGGALEFKGTSAPYRITLDMGYVPAQINELLVYGLESKEIGAYHLYFSDDADALFTAASWVGYYENTDSSCAQLIRFRQPHKEQFVGIEITDSGADVKAFYLKEIAVYGVRDFSGIPQSVYAYEVKEDIVNQAYINENHAYNLIRYARSTNTFDNGDAYTLKSIGSAATDGTVYDNTAYTWWTTAEFKPCCATYSLGQTVPIDRIMFASNYDSSTNYSTYLYEIYISTDKD